MTLRMLARDLAALPVDELWQLPDGDMEVEFDPLPDGTPQVLYTDSRLTIFSAYMWRLYVEYPLTPARITHHLGTDRMTATSHMTLLNRVMWACYDAYGGEVDTEELSKILYESTNAWFNAVSTRPELEKEVSTISIEDLIDVTEEPRIAQAIADITGSPMSIAKAHEVAELVLLEDGALPGNPISASMRSKLVSSSQVKQTLIARGSVTDIDSRYFSEAIPSSFLSGMNSMYESMTESRSSTKAAAYKEKPIQDSEYFNRRLQLLAATVMSVEHIVNGEAPLPGDCGTQRTVRWVVKPRDLEALAGKYYRSGDTLDIFKASDKHLVGKTVHFRSPLLCEYDGAQSICAVCYGDIALSVPRGTNIGHVAAVEYGERVTQNMLGIKHVDFTSGMRRIVLGPYEKEFFAVAKDERTLVLLPKYHAHSVVLSVSPLEADNLTELNFETDVTMIPVSRVSEISSFYMTLTNAKGDKETVPMNMEIGGKKANFTHAFLAHIQRNGYLLSDSGRYLISLDGFNREESIFEVPNRDENIMDYLNSIIQFISSTDDKESTKGIPDGPRRMLKHCRSVEEALLAFHELTSARMVVNIVHLEILIYSTMIRSAKHRDYRLPQPGNQLIFGQLGKLIGNRSMGSAMAFEKHSGLLTEPTTYTNRTRTDHPLDDLLVPRYTAT
jgi:hypothetical protein